MKNISLLRVFCCQRSAATAVMKTMVVVIALTSSNFILVLISFRQKQQVTVPAAMIRKRFMVSLPAARHAKVEYIMLNPIADL